MKKSGLIMIMILFQIFRHRHLPISAITELPLYFPKKPISSNLYLKSTFLKKLFIEVNSIFYQAGRN
ncbi:hypothetical protein [Chryseobacterium sp. CH21]|uniref:hypothetical protein n=1 Tax=Chryseobacterium sp. CH21 TaxID=713556 RepID=UPI00100B24D4|nr:hypothetical protein [Chryseobacterium sp. CH21]